MSSLTSGLLAGNWLGLGGGGLGGGLGGGGLGGGGGVLGLRLGAVVLLLGSHLLGHRLRVGHGDFRGRVLQARRPESDC